MQSVLRALLDLQEVDRDLFRVRSELKRLPAERAQRLAEIAKIQALHDEKRNHAKSLRVRIKELEDLATTKRQRVRKLENESNASRSDMALLAAFQHETKTLKREIGTAEEEGIGLLEQVEVADKDAVALQARIDAEKKVFEEFAANVDREIAAAEARRKELEGVRQSRASSAVPPDALAAYNRLIEAREGVALAHLDGRICQACYMEVPTNMAVRVARGNELVRCPSCDRILYLG